MAVRTGMANIIARTRRMVDDAGSAIWTDNQDVQNILDEHKIRVNRERLEMDRTNTSATTYEYKRFFSRYRDIEEDTSGTAYFQIEDATGTQRGTADYTMDYLRGMLEMTADQVGTALYMSGWSYDLNGAAADLWRERAATKAGKFDASVDGHNLTRSQWFDHCLKMSDYYAQRSRPMTVRAWRVGDFGDE